jgi:apolipoprotein N-acyltransferase
MDYSLGKTRSRLTQLREPTTTVVPAVVGSVLCWLALPPVGWSLLAWVGPIPWLVLVAQKQLPGRRPYRALWLGGFVFWLMAAHWIRLPHPLNHLAWLALAAYLGVYLPTFVALARVGVHRFRLPLWLAAPVVWTGLEWLRAHLLTGFLMGSLAHTQAEHLFMIQIANLVGEYGVTFLIVLVAGCLTQSLMSFKPRPARIQGYPLVVAAIAVGAALIYGAIVFMKDHSIIRSMLEPPGPRIALIQGNTLAEWKHDPDRQRRIMDEHVRLSMEAVQHSREQDGRDVDLVIWPETSFRETLITVEPGYKPPPERVPAANLTAALDYLKLLTRELGAALLVGIDRVHVFPDAQGKFAYQRYNSSVLVDAEGNLIGTYDKMHRVLFGEYIPFAEWFPALYRLTPLTGGIDAGTGPASLQLDGVLYSPNICYETVLPHLIRRLVAESPDGQSPDLLVNLTNDAWFWGSSELDMHLACGVFRAIETRIPLVIAANGGLSGYIDETGLLEVTARQEPTFLIVDVRLPRFGESVYSRWGDWFAILCVVCCVVLAIVGWRGRESPPTPAGVGDNPARQ